MPSPRAAPLGGVVAVLHAACELPECPLLVRQGQDDPGVVPEQGESMYEAMRRAGKTVDCFADIDEGHGFLHTGSLRDQFHRMVEFLTKHNGIQTE